MTTTKPFDEWSAEDISAALRVIEIFMEIYPARPEVWRWVARRIGMPMPPPELISPENRQEKGV